MTESEIIIKRRGFEALLRPFQDIVAKDWQLRLKNFLEEYLNYIKKITTIDFSEAALIVQNTSIYYSRRVDLMYKWVQQFCVSLNEDEEFHEKDEVSQKKKAYKKKNDHFILDVLDVFDCSSTANMQRTPLKLGGEPKLIKLNTNAQPLYKSGVICPLWQLNNDDMGHKDDFQLCDRLLNNGRLYREIIQRNIVIDNEIAEIEEENLLTNELCRGDSSERSMDASVLSPPSYNSKGSSSSLGESPPIESDFDNPEEVSDQDTCGKIIPFSDLIIHKKFKRVIFFSLPNEMINEVRGTPERVTRSSTSKESCHLSFSEILAGKSEDRITHRLRRRQSERLKVLKSKNKDLPVQSDVGNEDELEEGIADQNDFDDTLGSLRDDVGSDKTPRWSFDREIENKIETAYEESYKKAILNKKMSEGLSIQKRVAEWHARIQPTLEKAEQRSHFDPDEYGTRMIEKFQGLGETKPLKELIDAKEYTDVSRYLLSTLELTNTGNFEIIKLDSSDLASDCFAVKFINATRHHDQLNANIGAAASAKGKH